MRLSKKPWQRSSERGRGEIKCYRRKVGWGHQTKADSQFTVPAIEIWEEKGILGYENHTGGLRLLMQMLPNFSFIGPKVLPSPRKPLWRLGKFRLKGRKKRSRKALTQCFKRTQINLCSWLFSYFFHSSGFPASCSQKEHWDFHSALACQSVWELVLTFKQLCPWENKNNS